MSGEEQFKTVAGKKSRKKIKRGINKKKKKEKKG